MNNKEKSQCSGREGKHQEEEFTLIIIMTIRVTHLLVIINDILNERIQNPVSSKAINSGLFLGIRENEWSFT